MGESSIWGYIVHGVGRSILATAALAVRTVGYCRQHGECYSQEAERRGSDRGSRRRTAIRSDCPACHVIGSEQDCSSSGDEIQHRRLHARQADANVTYGVFSFVSNPEPAWACPGFVIGDQELDHTERIEPLGCVVPNSMTWSATASRPPLGWCGDHRWRGIRASRGTVSVCHEQGSVDCIGDASRGRRRQLDPDEDRIELVYDLGTFIASTGWPCPSYTTPDGTLFHFGGSGSFTADDFLAGIGLVIPLLDLTDCTPGKTVTVTDDSGNSMPTAGLFVWPRRAKQHRLRWRTFRRR